MSLALIAFGLARRQMLDPKQALERTCFQTSQPYSDRINLRADVAIVYGIDKKMPDRIKTWRDRGYRIHVMTGVAWGEYQDYLYGRFDGINHEDEAQTQRNGEKIGHGGDVYYMSPGKDYGKFLCVGVQRALDAGAEAIHLEEPEFWARAGYSEGFKREWQEYYHEPWQAENTSPDARWRSSMLKYYLYRRALQQVFDYIQAYNLAHGKHVRCYVPTHSLLNYSSWEIVSPESSLARLAGCDGYIAQVWTGTARTLNIYRGVEKERTFETAFLEYGAMQNLVRATGRRVWYLADPVEDDASHDWGDYRRNWQSTLTASLLQPEVSQYEVMPWPERIFNGTYPSEGDRNKRVPIPDEYGEELQVVINALKDMDRHAVRWQAGTPGIGVAIGDSLMFQRGGPDASDPRLSQIYGLALPFVKLGMPVQPVQLENVNLPGYLSNVKVLLMTYEGMKPLTPEVHAPIVQWVRSGGTLVFVDDDKDPFNSVREWWNTADLHYATPREHLFSLLGLDKTAGPGEYSVGRGRVLFLQDSPTALAHRAGGAARLTSEVQRIATNIAWKTSGSIVLRRGPYVIAAGLDETDAAPATLTGHFVDLFDPNLPAQTSVTVGPDSRHLLVDLDRFRGDVIACTGYLSDAHMGGDAWTGTVEGIGGTLGTILLRSWRTPASATVDGAPAITVTHDEKAGLTRIQFRLTAKPQPVRVVWAN